MSVAVQELRDALTRVSTELAALHCTHGEQHHGRDHHTAGAEREQPISELHAAPSATRQAAS